MNILPVVAAAVLLVIFLGLFVRAMNRLCATRTPDLAPPPPPRLRRPRVMITVGTLTAHASITATGSLKGDTRPIALGETGEVLTTDYITDAHLVKLDRRAYAWVPDWVTRPLDPATQPTGETNHS